MRCCVINIKFCFAEKSQHCTLVVDRELCFYYPSFAIQIWLEVKDWGVTHEFKCPINLFFIPDFHLKTIVRWYKLQGIELHSICPLLGSFPLAFPDPDALFHWLPVVAYCDLDIVTGGTLVALKIWKLLISTPGWQGNVDGPGLCHN